MAETSTPWRFAAAQVLVADLHAPELDDDAAHHLGRVLRLRDGVEVCATDGRGGWRSTRVVAPGRGASLRIEAAGPVLQQPAPSPTLTVAFALTKGDKPELVVQKLTELGIDRIVPFTSERSVVRWDDERASRQLSRLRRVATEACAQCRRLWLPVIGTDGPDGSDGSDHIPTTAELLAGAPGVVADAGGRPLQRSDHMVLVGPEGGWADGEVGTDRVALGEHILRAETAAITAGVLMAALRSA